MSEQTRDELVAEIAHLQERNEQLENELQAATITMEKIRDALMDVITGRIQDWINSQGETETR